MCSNFYTLKLIITHFKPFIVKLQNKEMCFQQQQLHTTAETVESEHSLNCKIHNTWTHQTTEIHTQFLSLVSCTSWSSQWQHKFVWGGDERSSWVVLGLQDVTITCSEASQQHFGCAPEKILPGLRHCAAQLDSKTGFGKAAPGEIPTGVKSY